MRLGLTSPSLDALAQSLRGARAAGVQALVVVRDFLTSTLYQPISKISRDLRLATMAEERRYPDAGALMSYGVGDRDQFGRAAGYVDASEGRAPADLPIEQPTGSSSSSTRRPHARSAAHPTRCVCGRRGARMTRPRRCRGAPVRRSAGAGPSMQTESPMPVVDSSSTPSPFHSLLHRGVRAQTPGRVYRLGILRPTGPAPFDVNPRALRLWGMSRSELLIDRRYAEGRLERLPVFARELVAGKVDAIVAVGGVSVRAALTATSTVPIVMFGNFDPIAGGIVKSLGRPGGNVTGVLIAPDGTLAGKKLELLREVVPRATRVGMLSHYDPSVRQQWWKCRRRRRRSD